MDTLLILTFIILVVTIPWFSVFCLMLIFIVALIIAWVWSLVLIADKTHFLIAMILAILSIIGNTIAITIIVLFGAIQSLFKKDTDELLFWLWGFVLVVLVLL